jgi:hypothetical protein
MPWARITSGSVATLQQPVLAMGDAPEQPVEQGEALRVAVADDDLGEVRERRAGR